ncbi:hypothetical protein DEI99_006295 [Curtobacterium sp. MCLR17_036]|uniref:hypothetical protein n=1 Tax=Curtobacterium sp. MCLR17_036 TaxID=2175620 RepID=UPI0011B55896|nr:hypothetical protein [Curtobacterium sp. MCLR17_036]WIE66141.1 hypothetical protein DEI99_006295 [Curtobacterium sp. MCLR17_036]
MMHKSGNRRPVLSAGSVTVVIGLMIGGCTVHDGFAPLEARDFLEQSRGVDAATVTTGGLARTFGRDYFVNVRMTVDPSLGEDRLRSLALCAVQTGWATRIAHAPYGVKLEVLSDSDVDVLRLLEDANLEVQAEVDQGNPVLVSADSLQRQWGRWPGRRPGARCAGANPAAAAVLAGSTAGRLQRNGSAATARFDEDRPRSGERRSGRHGRTALGSSHDL